MGGAGFLAFWCQLIRCLFSIAMRNMIPSWSQCGGRVLHCTEEDVLTLCLHIFHRSCHLAVTGPKRVPTLGNLTYMLDVDVKLCAHSLKLCDLFFLHTSTLRGEKPEFRWLLCCVLS